MVRAAIVPYLEYHIFSSSEEAYDSETPLRFFSMKNYIYVPISMVICQKVLKSIKDH